MIFLVDFQFPKKNRKYALKQILLGMNLNELDKKMYKIKIF